MAEEALVLLSGGEAELVEKKSRFLAALAPISSEEEANAFFAERKKKHWDARHNCTAFVLGAGAELTRCSDDGEPAGTAGRPMLEALLSSGVRNAAVCVTRYFGGVLLGTGGLVRAYSQAVREGLAACEVGRLYRGVRLELRTDYNDYGKVQYLLAQRGIEPEDGAFGAEVTFSVLARLGGENGKDALIRELVDATAGRIRIAAGEPGDFVERIGRERI